MPILDQYGKPYGYSEQREALAKANAHIRSLQLQIRREINARYDAAQTTYKNENHWANADTLDPHAANSLGVRARLRTRSRYEVIENNPYLKGIFLTICNDFVGSGPRLEITETNISKKRRKEIETTYDKWFAETIFRRKLWQIRMDRGVSGEGFFLNFYDSRLEDTAVKLNYKIYECDQVSSESQGSESKQNGQYYEIDGIRFDEYDRPLYYHFLHQHPGANYMHRWLQPFIGGTWIPAERVIHWIRRDRNWQRGIPETTASLPLCALMRRYTLAVVSAAEIQASNSAVLETEMPARTTPFDPADDDPFDTFPIEHGMMVTLPFGYKMKQFNNIPHGQLYDMFIGSLLREIVRPLLVPFNIAGGTSKDSNMASAVVDTHVYRGGQKQARLEAQEDILDPTFKQFWKEYRLVYPGFKGYGNTLNTPAHRWTWDQVMPDHTDPQKIWNAVATAKEMGFITDKDIQETYFNRDVEDWRNAIKEDIKFRKDVGLTFTPNSQSPNDTRRSVKDTLDPADKPATVPTDVTPQDQAGDPIDTPDY